MQQEMQQCTNKGREEQGCKLINMDVKDAGLALGNSIYNKVSEM